MDKIYTEPFRISAEMFADERGVFIPLEVKKELEGFNLTQLNTVATIKAYTFRGLHWQEPPYAQAKLIRCSFGKIIDFAVDIRVGSPKYGQSYGFTLSDPNEWVYIPEGFAHGYITLPHNLGDTFPTLVDYLINNEYNKESERGIFMTADVMSIMMQELPNGKTDLIMNDRDWNWPSINEIETKFRYEPDEQ